MENANDCVFQFENLMVAVRLGIIKPEEVPERLTCHEVGNFGVSEKEGDCSSGDAMRG